MNFRMLVLGAVVCMGSAALAESPYRVLEASKGHLVAVQSSSYDRNSCRDILGALQADLRQLSWNDYSNEVLKAHAVETMDLFWQLRLAIHAKLDLVGRDCTMQVRDVFSRLRDGEDYLVEFTNVAAAMTPENMDLQKGLTPIYQHAPYETYLIRPDLNQSTLQLHNGDVLLARGLSFISAIIPRMTDNLSGFSHSLIWSADPGNREEHSVEAYLDSGVQKYQSDFALKNDNVRLTVLRPKDATMGARAVQFANQAADLKTPYDYKMNMNDSSAVTCVELVTSSYEKATGGGARFPLYPGQVAVKSTNFLTKLGVQPGEVVSPVDLETDPRFELVSDWRDNRLVRDSRHKDAILSEMLRWVDVFHYQLKNTSQSFIAKYILQPAQSTAIWPLVHKLTGVSINPEMPKSMLGVAVVMKQVGEKLLTEVRKMDQDYIAQYGRPMTNIQLRAALEKFRAEDLRRYNDNEHSAIHAMFNPY